MYPSDVAALRQQSWLHKHRKKSLLQRHVPGLVFWGVLISIILMLLINVGAVHTKPTSGFTHYYTNYHILQFTTSVGNDPPWNRYGVRFYLNAVWAQPQFSGSNSDARPVYQAVGRPFNVNDVLAEVHNIFPADEAHTTHIQLGDISTLASFVLYIIGILSSISVLPILCLVNANFSPQYTPSSRTKARLQTGIVALSALGTALGLAASISLTAQARNAVKALNSPVNSETTGDASVGSVFLGLTWGLVAAQIVNTVLLATQFVSEQRSW